MIPLKVIMVEILLKLEIILVEVVVEQLQLV